MINKLSPQQVTDRLNSNGYEARVVNDNSVEILGVGDLCFRGAVVSTDPTSTEEQTIDDLVDNSSLNEDDKPDIRALLESWNESWDSQGA